MNRTHEAVSGAKDTDETRCPMNICSVNSEREAIGVEKAMCNKQLGKAALKRDRGQSQADRKK